MKKKLISIFVLMLLIQSLAVFLGSTMPVTEVKAAPNVVDLTATDDSGQTLSSVVKMLPNGTKYVRIIAEDDQSNETDVTLQVKWRSTNSRVATIKKDKIYTNGKSGEATLTGTYGGKTVSIEVNTNISSLTYKFKEDSIDTDEEEVLDATKYDGCYYIFAKPSAKSYKLDIVADGVNIEDRFKWTVTNQRLAAVNSGTITITGKPGTVNVIGTYGSYKITYCIQIPTIKIKLNKSIVLVDADSSETITPKLYYIYNNYEKEITSFTSSDIIWSTSDSQVATISDGTVNGVAKGNCKVTAFYSGASTGITVLVKND